MDVCLLSRSRIGADGAGGWSHALAARSAAVLRDRGCAVRWLWAGALREVPPPAPAGVELLACPGDAPPFRRVEARVLDVAVDVTLNRTLRSRPADIVHDIGYGAPGSSNSLWLADRLGARCVATVRAGEVLCHRGSLITGDGVACDESGEPERCRRCCLVPGSGGLSAGAARLGRSLAWLGGRSPFPHAAGFRNRMDHVLGGLGLAAAVLVEHPRDAALLAAAGIKASALRVGALAAGHGDGLPDLYDALRRN